MAGVTAPVGSVVVVGLRAAPARAAGPAVGAVAAGVAGVAEDSVADEERQSGVSEPAPVED